MQSVLTSWGRMAYERRAGDGPALILLHGTGCSSEGWCGVVAQLPAQMAYVALDFRGHGQSTVPTAPFTLDDLASDVLDLLSQLRLEEVWLAGHSLGGMVAMAVAERSAAACGLVLLEGWTRLAVVQQAYEPGRFYGALGAEAIATIEEQHRAMREGFGPGLWAHFWASVERFDAAPYLARATIPIWEVYGGMGQRPGAREALAVPERPNIHELWIPDAGHYLPHERPREVAAACLQALIEGDNTRPWYHGSPLMLASLRPGSTITRDRALARVFSHKPTLVVQDVDERGQHILKHSGAQPGFLYRIAEELRPGDVYPHPRTTMPPGQEWLTLRTLRVELIERTAIVASEILTTAEIKALARGPKKQ